MQIQSRSMYLGTGVLQQMASDYGWWNPKSRPNGRVFTNEEVILIKAVKKYTNWRLTTLADMMGATYHNVIGATRLTEPRLIASRIPDYFYEITGMTKGRGGPEGVARIIEHKGMSLSDEDVAIIRRLRSAGVSSSLLAKIFKRSVPYIAAITRGDARGNIVVDEGRVEERTKKIIEENGLIVKYLE